MSGDLQPGHGGNAGQAGYETWVAWGIERLSVYADSPHARFEATLTALEPGDAWEDVRIDERGHK